MPYSASAATACATAPGASPRSSRRRRAAAQQPVEDGAVQHVVRRGVEPLVHGGPEQFGCRVEAAGADLRVGEDEHAVGVGVVALPVGEREGPSRAIDRTSLPSMTSHMAVENDVSQVSTMPVRSRYSCWRPIHRLAVAASRSASPNIQPAQWRM